MFVRYFKRVLILISVLFLTACGSSNNNNFIQLEPVENLDIERPELFGELEVGNTLESGAWYSLGDYQGIPGYSGPLATYTSSHTPVAVMFNRSVYSTFSNNDKGYLEIFVKRDDEPAVRVAKLSHTIDPHQNASLNIDRYGYIWIFVASRGITFPGYIYKSKAPLVLNFRLYSKNYFAYPQPWFTDQGLSLLYSGYERAQGTELFMRTIWHNGNGCDAKIVDGGHYFVSYLHDNTIHVFYNLTPSGNVSIRRNIYYIKSEDGGCTWRNRAGEKLSLPIAETEPLTLVYDSGASNVFLSDAFVFDENPVLLFVSSPNSNPYNGKNKAMLYRPYGVEFITDVGHQYNVGYYYYSNNEEFVLMPTKGIANYAGGDLVLFRKVAESWTPISSIQGNFNYARRVFRGHGHGVVSEGNPMTLSPVSVHSIQIR